MNYIKVLYNRYNLHVAYLYDLHNIYINILKYYLFILIFYDIIILPKYIIL